MARSENGTQTVVTEKDFFIYIRHLGVQVSGDEIDAEMNGGCPNSTAVGTPDGEYLSDQCRVGVDDEGNRVIKGSSKADEDVRCESQAVQVGSDILDKDFGAIEGTGGDGDTSVNEIEEWIAANQAKDVETMTDASSMIDHGIQTDLGCHECAKRKKQADRNDVTKVEADTSTSDGNGQSTSSFFAFNDPPATFDLGISDIENYLKNDSGLEFASLSETTSILENAIPAGTDNDGIVVEEASDSEISCSGSMSSDIFSRHRVL